MEQITAARSRELFGDAPFNALNNQLLTAEAFFVTDDGKQLILGADVKDDEGVVGPATWDPDLGEWDLF